MFKKRKASSQPSAAKTLGLDAETENGGARTIRHPIRQAEEDEEEDAVVIDRNKARLKSRSHLSLNKTGDLFDSTAQVAASMHSTDADTAQSTYSTEEIAKLKEQTRIVDVNKLNPEKFALNEQISSNKPMILNGDDAKQYLREDPGYDGDDVIQSEDEEMGPIKPTINNNGEAIPSSSNRISPAPEVMPGDSEEEDDDESEVSDAVNGKANVQNDPEEIVNELKVLRENLRAKEEEIRNKNLAKSETSMNTIDLEEKRSELVLAVKRLSEVESIVRYCKALRACQRLKMVQMTKADDPKLVWQEVNDEFVHPQLIIEKFVPLANSDSERFSKRVAPVLGNVLVPHILARLWTEPVEFDGLDSFLRQDEEITNALSKITSKADRDQVIQSLLLGVRERYSEFSMLAQSDY